MTFPVPPAWVVDTVSFLNWLATGPGVVSEYARAAEGWKLELEDCRLTEMALDEAGHRLEDRLPRTGDYPAMVSAIEALAALGAAALGVLEAHGALSPDDAKDTALASALLGALLPAQPTGQGS